MLVALGETPRGEGDGNAGQDDRETAAQQQEAFGTTQRAPHRGLRVVDVLDALTRFEALTQPVAQGRKHRSFIRGEQLPVAHPAAGPHHAGGGNIGDVHHHPRAGAQEAPAPVRLAAQRRRHAQGRLTDAHLVADRDTQQREQARI